MGSSISNTSDSIHIYFNKLTNSLANIYTYDVRPSIKSYINENVYKFTFKVTPKPKVDERNDIVLIIKYFKKHNLHNNFYLTYKIFFDNISIILYDIDTICINILGRISLSKGYILYIDENIYQKVDTIPSYKDDEFENRSIRAYFNSLEKFISEMYTLTGPPVKTSYINNKIYKATFKLSHIIYNKYKEALIENIEEAYVNNDLQPISYLTYNLLPNMLTVILFDINSISINILRHIVNIKGYTFFNRDDSTICAVNSNICRLLHLQQFVIFEQDTPKQSTKKRIEHIEKDSYYDSYSDSDISIDFNTFLENPNIYRVADRVSPIENDLYIEEDNMEKYTSFNYGKVLCTTNT